jgi:hypothetical protein
MKHCQLKKSLDPNEHANPKHEINMEIEIDRNINIDMDMDMDTVMDIIMNVDIENTPKYVNKDSYEYSLISISCSMPKKKILLTNFVIIVSNVPIAEIINLAAIDMLLEY